jgi:hypothetical protein
VKGIFIILTVIAGKLESRCLSTIDELITSLTTSMVSHATLSVVRFWNTAKMLLIREKAGFS